MASAESAPPKKDQFTKPFMERFAPGWHRSWRISNFDMAAESFVTSWRRKQVEKVIDGPVRLTLKPNAQARKKKQAPQTPKGNDNTKVAVKENADKDKENAKAAGKGDDKKSKKAAKARPPKPFLGSELQWHKKVSFGRYEVVMTAAHGDGLVSSFFTYTGKYFGTPHEEIDIEFLGRDTTQVHLNTFINGKSKSPKTIDLGFDASKEPHIYAFEWHPDAIVWFVDNREIYRVSITQHKLPVLPSKLMVNLWAVADFQAKWAGRPAPDTTAKAEYHCASYRPFGSKAKQCSDVYKPPTPKKP